MAVSREKLVREVFELDRDIAYPLFRQMYMADPEVVAACPCPGVREQMLRGFWKKDAEIRYPEYQENVAALSLDDLARLRGELREQLLGLSLDDFAERGKYRSPESQRGPER